MNENIKSNIKKYIIIFFTAMFLFSILSNIFFIRQYRKSNSQLKEYRTTAERTAELNKQLTDTTARQEHIIGQLRSREQETEKTVERLSEITNTTAGTIQETIELLEQIRSQVELLQSSSSGDSADTDNSNSNNNYKNK